MSRLALAGLRVLDLTQVAAGPYTTLMLGFLGAEVIKVESCRRPDIGRGPVAPQPNQYHHYPDQQPGDRPWNRHAHHSQRNRNKLSLTLDLTEPAGKDVLLRLLPLCDVLIENYRASVLERWGLGWDVLQAVAPRLIYVKLSSQGNTGPERDYGSLGLTLECTAGLASVTGYREDGQPRMTNEVYPDPVVGILAVGAFMAALRRRRRTGEGCFVDLSQREVTTCLIGDAVLDYSMNGRVTGPIGNRHSWQAPHGVYPCRGEDAWVAIAVGSDAEWAG
ncbi:MAG TPA: CoA transferase, partial [Dehalococcoidia bacterium]|nr:CoA transferase [Dehalococcoidia bacterium]